MSSSIKILNLVKQGEHLERLGVNNWAVTRSQALILLQLLKEANIPVYGGDVYVRNQNQIDLTNDNWFCEINNNEDEASYVKRSVSHAKSYIDKFRSIELGEKLFVLIFDISLVT